ncbi:hypothetical protein AXG93_2446s1010 [Marchantia polymorpha subsp. ruderalis]|uniref:Bidirectional sugar transporter SWEET n=1 Tax=Marchantia polymorpha subsp. ruderalis TaxID=1480154 RepID=A0A176W6V0_MARPO|nr:hypothetical protein AXG93_2446s1010 [Marchantia polymorpha subsp. ruderalis]
MSTKMSTAEFVVGFIGAVVSIFLFLSPFPTFKKIIKLRSTEEYSAVPYVATLLNCSLWLLYGSPFVNKGVLVFTINGAGAFIELFFICIYLAYSKDRRTRRNAVLMITAIVIFFVAVLLINLLGIHRHSKRQTVVGILCVIIGTSMYVSPLTIMKTVITTKSTEFMPLPLSVFNLLNGIIWTTYALIGHDLYITIPNALGVFFALCQLTLYGCFCGNTRRMPTEITENAKGVPPDVMSVGTAQFQNHAEV